MAAWSRGWRVKPYIKKYYRRHPKNPNQEEADEAQNKGWNKNQNVTKAPFKIQISGQWERRLQGRATFKIFQKPGSKS
jgi:hypothetical protein